MSGSEPIQGADPSLRAPTTPWGSALLYAVAGVAGSAAAVWAIIGGLFAVWRLYIVRDLKPPPLPAMPLLWATVIAYYMAGAFSALLFPADQQSLQQVVERLPFLLMPPLLLLLARSEAKALLNWSACGAAIGVAISATYLLVTFDPVLDVRAEALSGNANVFGYTHALLVVLLSLGWGLSGHRWLRVTFAISIPLAFGLIYLSGSRGALISAVLTCVIMAWFSLHRWSVWTRIAALLAVLAFSVAVLSTTPLADRFTRTLNDLSAEKIDYAGTNGARLAMWQCGVSNALETPFIGPGHDAALLSLETCLREQFGVKMRVSHFHNLFLDQFAKGGIVALIPASLLAFLPFIFLLAWRAHAPPISHVHSSGFLSQRQMLMASILSLFATQMVASLFNIGFGHDVLDAGFIYTFVLLFGLLHAHGCEPSLTHGLMRPDEREL
ncbi:MAG: O-antigen ligase family protein [Pseudomonadota bacterium]